MTNPNNIVRVRARNGGRASVYEANAWAQAFTSGLFEGNGVLQNTSADMNVLVGGSATKPDVVLATNPAGYKIALDLVGQQAIAITAPASNSRISAIVAYTNDLSVASTQTSVTGSPASCGLIVVNGTASSSPVAPTDTQIRNAITADGATGSQAAYCIIATIKVASGTTIINDALITNNVSHLGSNKIDFATSIDSADWQKVPLSGNAILYLKRGSFTKTMDGRTWTEQTASQKPADLNTSHTYFGGAGGVSSDHAINVSGYVDFSAGKVQIQNQNIYDGSVSTTIYWWAYIIEIVD